jgi:hypothetical protein
VDDSTMIPPCDHPITVINIDDLWVHCDICNARLRPSTREDRKAHRPPCDHPPDRLRRYIGAHAKPHCAECNEDVPLEYFQAHCIHDYSGRTQSRYDRSRSSQSQKCKKCDKPRGS